jgi:prepilin-type N-terminal cleavage/methylation domain-containing protein
MPGPERALGREGFTLLEVVVALTIAALLLLGARVMLGEVADGAARIADAATRADREANAERTLRDLAGRIELLPDSGRGVAGDARGVRFATWCDVPGGWQERCTASLGFIRSNGQAVLVLEAGPAPLLVVRRGFATGGLIYLSDPGNGGAWVDAWTARAAVPPALGVVVDDDTLLLRVGDRQ